MRLAVARERSLAIARDDMSNGANKGRVGGSQRRTANSTPYSKKTGCHSEWSETE